MLLSTEYDVVLGMTISEIQETVHTEEWVMQNACNCIYVPCSFQHFQPCNPKEYEVGRVEKWCWLVGGSVSATGKTGLLTALFGQLGISATVTTNFDYCVSLEERYTIATQPLNCFHVFARFRYSILKVEGTVTEAEAVRYWECFLPWGEVPMQTMCGVKTSTGWADSYGVREFHNTQLPPSCHGPNPPWAMHDGKTSEPCCEVTGNVGCPDAADPHCAAAGVGQTEGEQTEMTTRLIRIVAVATFLLPLFGNFPAYGATWVDERLVLIQQELATAREMRSLGQPGYGDLLRRSAAGLARLGHTGEAIQVLDEVIASPETDLDRPSALRQLGQYRLRQGRTADAIVAFEQQIAAYDAQPELITRFPAGFASGVSQSSELLSLSGRVEEAIVMNERLLGTHRSSFQAAVLSDAMARKSRLLQRKGENAAAVQAIDELFLAYPEYGRDNGAAILLRMSRARLVDPTKRSNEYVAALRDLWDDPRYSGALGTLDVGLELVRVRNERHEAEESLQAAMSVVQRIDARREAWLQEEPNNVQIGRVIRRAEKTALVRLQSGSSAGRRDLTIYALQRLILGAETHELRENLQSQLNFVMQQP